MALHNLVSSKYALKGCVTLVIKMKMTAINGFLTLAAETMLLAKEESDGLWEENS
ncbi:Hypothetical predicted protein [Podarcis lilfordi]|uniref:Uncharacterized protein n=1 Tax=Podarcis lilfordi TaxID=74358 RepID=A0AA35K9C9_9SAUR|nr:Hypothetical predicted protein [Podarcis lilfordi]